MKKKKEVKVGIAFGSGGARGLAHIGVLKVFEKNDLPINFLAGTSFGSIVAGLYATGLSSFEIEDAILSVDHSKILDFSIPREGFIKGEKFENLLKHLTSHKTFSQCVIPLRIVASDISCSKQYLFSIGPVARAIRASCAAPGLFKPVRIKNHVLVDGMLFNPIPVDVVKAMGSDVTVAVDVISGQIRFHSPVYKNAASRFHPIFSPRISLINAIERPNSPFFRIMESSVQIMEGELSRKSLELSKPNILITPSLKGLDWLDFEKSEKIIRSGELAARKIIPKLKLLLNN